MRCDSCKIDELPQAFLNAMKNSRFVTASDGTFAYFGENYCSEIYVTLLKDPILKGGVTESDWQLANIVVTFCSVRTDGVPDVLDKRIFDVNIMSEVASRLFFLRAERFIINNFATLISEISHLMTIVNLPPNVY